jgi:hypothetical protein
LNRARQITAHGRRGDLPFKEEKVLKLATTTALAIIG